MTIRTKPGIYLYDGCPDSFDGPRTLLPHAPGIAKCFYSDKEAAIETIDMLRNKTVGSWEYELSHHFSGLFTILVRNSIGQPLGYL